MFEIVLATALAIVIVIALPVRSSMAYEALRAAAPTDPTALMRSYRRSTIVKWALVPPLVLLYALLGDQAFVEWRGTAWPTGPLMLVPLAIAVGLVTYLQAKSVSRRAAMQRQLRPVSAILPRTTAERRMFVVVAITAGVVEELAFRAFLMDYLAWLLRIEDGLVLSIITGALFGLAHAYQGWKGVLTTGVLGVALGLVYLTDGLIAVIAVHALLDLRLLLVPVEALVPGDDAAPTGPIPNTI